jgi:hypothetical protein
MHGPLICVSVAVGHRCRRLESQTASAALTPNSDTIAGQNLARWLSYTIFLDCLVLFCWTLAGSLSIFQGVVERYYELPHITFVGLLYIALLSFAARVLLRAYTRAFINKL